VEVYQVARLRNRSQAARARARQEYALTIDGKRLLINEIIFLSLAAAGIIELSRKRANQGRLKSGWSFKRETIENEHNKLSASHDEWVLRRLGDSSQEIVLSDAALISFLGVLIRRRARMK
jgi:hypothetical protein